MKALNKNTDGYYYFPKGGMCASCSKVTNDCSHLEFDIMRVIEKVELESCKYKIVRCTEYKK